MLVWIKRLRITLILLNIYIPIQHNKNVITIFLRFNSTGFIYVSHPFVTDSKINIAFSMFIESPHCNEMLKTNTMYILTSSHLSLVPFLWKRRHVNTTFEKIRRLLSYSKTFSPKMVSVYSKNHYNLFQSIN